MRKRISARTICLLVAAVMLVGALTVSAINGSPYEHLKNAAFNALFIENVTIEMEASLRIDGEAHESVWMQHQQGDESALVLNRIHSPLLYEVDEELLPFAQDIFSHMSYELPGLSISRWSTMPGGTRWFQASRNRSPDWMGRSIGHEIFGQAGRDSNHLRLAELLLDLVVGDLKNILVMSNQDGLRRISGEITESQLPEFVRVIIDIAIDEQLNRANTGRRREDYLHVLEIPIRSLSIDRIALVADIDSDGNLVYINGRAAATIENIFGDIHVVEGEVSVRFTYIGTTVPESPVIGAYELFTEAFFENKLGSRWNWSALYFTVDDDGNINYDSITTQRPWRLTRQDLIDFDISNFDLSSLDFENLDIIDSLTGQAPFTGGPYIGLSADEMERLSDILSDDELTELMQQITDMNELMSWLFAGDLYDHIPEEIMEMLEELENFQELISELLRQAN